MRWFAILLLASLVLSADAGAFELPKESQQVIVGISEGWNSSYVTLSFFERGGDGRWMETMPQWKGRLGRNGLAWGRGLHPVPKGVTMKREGDMRAPAGVFFIGGAWGYDEAIQKAPSLSYVRVTPRCLWFEDVNSPHYNRYLQLDHEPRSTAEKKAQMKQNDYAHSLKLFIAHNAYPNIQPGAGSSIFFHIWRGGGSKPTAGCTTMAEDKLRALIARIVPEKYPTYVLLPRAEYDRLRGGWKLP